MSQDLVLLPDEMVQLIIEALNDINAIVNFVSSSRGRRLPQTTFIQLLQSQFDRNLAKLPAPVKAVLSINDAKAQLAQDDTPLLVELHGKLVQSWASR